MTRSRHIRGVLPRRLLLLLGCAAVLKRARGFTSGAASQPAARSAQSGSLRFWQGPDKPLVKDVLALDFDGVVCDSAGESGRAAFKSVKRIWPQIAAYCAPAGQPQQLDGEEELFRENDMPAWLSDAMRQLRPVVETGYENVLLARLCIEQYVQGSQQASAIPIKDTMNKWHESLRGALLQKYGVTAQELVDLFGSVRDDWMAEDPRGWLGANRFYTGSDLCMGCPRFDAYVITTKQARFVEALLQHKGVSFPRERIFGLGSGPKTDVLARLVKAQRDKASNDPNQEREAVVHFVEDRVETLERVCADPRLQSVRLYFADWGYSTPEQRMRALYNPRVTVLDLADFSCMCRLLDPNRQDGYPCFVPTCKDKRLSPERFSFIPPPPGAAPSTDNRQQAGEGAAAAVEQEEGGGEASLSCEEAGGPRGQQAAVEEEEAEEEGSSEEEGRASP